MLRNGASAGWNLPQLAMSRLSFAERGALRRGRMAFPTPCGGTWESTAWRWLADGMDVPPRFNEAWLAVHRKGLEAMGMSHDMLER